MVISFFTVVRLWIEKRDQTRGPRRPSAFSKPALEKSPGVSGDRHHDDPDQKLDVGAHCFSRICLPVSDTLFLVKCHTEALRKALSEAWCSFHRDYHPRGEFACYRGKRERYCRRARAEYMRDHRAKTGEAAKLRERYRTDEAYRERCKARSRETMRAFRAR